MLTTSLYEFARARIADGDIVVVRGRGTLLAAATRLLLKTPYTHTAVALWIDGHVWLAEMVADTVRGNVLVPLAKYEYASWDLFACPPAAKGLIRKVVFEHLDGATPYGFGDLFHILVRRALFTRSDPPDNSRMVCSSFTAHLLREAGWAPEEPLPYVAAPSEVAAALGIPYLSYRPGG